MKPICAVMAFFVVFLSAVIVDGQTVTAKVSPRNSKELESRLKELDRVPDNDIVVKLTKSERSSTDKTMDYKLKLESRASKQILLDVNLSQIAEPSQEQIDAMTVRSLTSTTSTTMCGSIESVSIAQVGVTKDYAVQKDYPYDRETYKITVPKGFIYDRASIPRVFWWFISPDELGNVAPLLHDYLYRHGGKLPNPQVAPYRTFTRLETDDLFLEVMTKCEVESWRRTLAYEAVRLMSEFAWKEQ